jgi:hypothetical protein
MRLVTSPARFKVAAAGRRSGKTARAKQEGVALAMGDQPYAGAVFAFLAPTRDQAKRIFWKDVKGLIPAWAKLRTSESELTIDLWNGAVVMVVGMDKPQRLEGIAIRWFVFDEYAEAKPDAWKSTLRPACSTVGKEGGGWFIGRPRGRNHFYKLWRRAGEEAEAAAAEGRAPEWDAFQWKSDDVLPLDEIMSARRDLDEMTYLQEYEAEFLNFEGRVYYAFDEDVHASEPVRYDPKKPIILTFDFNVEPGTAAIVQELRYAGPRADVSRDYTGVIGEVWIERDSTTPKVCEELLYRLGPDGDFRGEDGNGHSGEVHVYADATGGARGTAKVKGSDVDLIGKILRKRFGKRLKMRIPKANPNVRARVNAMNSRLLSIDGDVSFLVDPDAAPHVANDLIGVQWKRGAGGDTIDKDYDR